MNRGIFVVALFLIAGVSGAPAAQDSNETPYAATRLIGRWRTIMNQTLEDTRAFASEEVSDLMEAFVSPGAVRAVQDKKAVNVVVLDLRKAGGFTDYFVICTGTNPRQIHAIADSVEETLRADFGERPHLTEGVEKSQWILLDYFNFVVHVFSRECRDFYALERLWGNAARHEFSEEA